MADSLFTDKSSAPEYQPPQKRIKAANAPGAAGTQTATPKENVTSNKTVAHPGNNASAQMNATTFFFPGPAERDERAIKCVPCLKALLSGTGDGICHNGPAARCVRCYPSIYEGRCVPTPAVVQDMARELHAVIKRRYRIDFNDKKLKELRTAIEMVLERSNVITATVISDALATGVVSKPVRALAAPAAPVAPAVPVAPVQPVKPAAPSTADASIQRAGHGTVAQVSLPIAQASSIVRAFAAQRFANYNERRTHFINAIEPLVDRELLPAIARFLDRYFK